MGSERGGSAPTVALTSTWLHTYHVLLTPQRTRSLGSDSAPMCLHAFLCANCMTLRHRRRGCDLSWLEANAEELPLADASVDSYTIAFGLRNVTRPEVALAEAARVLRPGGRLLVLEFSHVEFEPLRAAYDAYSFAAIPAMGRLVTGDAAPYQYLVESIRQFATQDELADMMRVRVAC